MDKRFSSGKGRNMIRTGLDSSKENILTAMSPRDTQVAAGARFFHRPFVKRISALFVVLLAVSLPYFQLTKAYFVGYDDFNEFRRTIFVDTRQPSKIFTTGHSAVKYRPLNRAINYVFYYIGHGSPGIFRTRNVVFHLLNTALLFSLGILLFDSIFIAALGAALFGLNPLAHQSVAGAIWANTAAESMLLIAAVLGTC